MTAVLLIGALGVIVIGSLGLALARAGSREMPPMPVDQRLRAALRAEAERLYPDEPCSPEDGWCVCVPEPSDPRWAQ